MGDQNPRFTFHYRILDRDFTAFVVPNADGQARGGHLALLLGGLDDGFSFLSRTPGTLGRGFVTQGDKPDCRIDGLVILAADSCWRDHALTSI
jgi:hypothetical protein